MSFEALEVRVLASTSKARKERVVPFTEEFAAILQSWQKEQRQPKQSDPLLPWPHDTYRQLYEDWHLIQTAAGVSPEEHYVPKNCRSTCASEMIVAGVPTVVVKDFLGHATVATTENYYINTKPALRAAANARRVRIENGQKNPSVDRRHPKKKTKAKKKL